LLPPVFPLEVCKEVQFACLQTLFIKVGPAIPQEWQRFAFAEPILEVEVYVPKVAVFEKNPIRKNLQLLLKGKHIPGFTRKGKSMPCTLRQACRAPSRG
jgi:hypothetical protein